MQIKLMKTIHEGQYQEYMKMVLQGARELGVQVDKRRT